MFEQPHQPESQTYCSISQQLDSLELPETHTAGDAPQPAASNLLVNAPYAAAAAAAAPFTAAAAGSAGLVAAGEADSPRNAAAPAAQVEKAKKGHRRGRSFTGLIPTLKTKPKRSVSELLPVRHQYSSA